MNWQQQCTDLLKLNTFVLQTCPNSDIFPDPSARRLLRSSDQVPSLGSGMSRAGIRKLLQGKNYPFFPNNPAEALAIVQITHFGMQAVFALCAWIIQGNNFQVSRRRLDYGTCFLVGCGFGLSCTRLAIVQNPLRK